MKKLLSFFICCLIILSAFFINTGAVNAKKSKTKLLVKIILYDKSKKLYSFKVTTNKKFTVKKYFGKKISKSKVLKTKDYKKLKSLVKKTKDNLLCNYNRNDKNNIKSKISINGKKYKSFIYGNYRLAGYDQVVTRLIKLSPVYVLDKKGFEIQINYEERFGGMNSNIDYALNKITHTLTFTGKGKMNDYGEYCLPPWIDDYHTPKKVVVNDGITRICKEAFSADIDGNSGEPRYYFYLTKSIKIPESVTEIGDCAFYYCHNLQSIKLPKKLNKIGERAFEECKSIKTLTIPDGVTKIGEYFCRGCEKLEEVKLGKNITIIDSCAFSDTNLKLVKLQPALKKIGFMAFASCKQLEEINIPEGLQYIDDFAFLYCGLTSVTIPKPVTHIGYEAFGYKWDDKMKAFGPDKTFIIKGYKGSEAERYAKANGFSFIAV